MCSGRKQKHTAPKRLLEIGLGMILNGSGKFGPDVFFEESVGDVFETFQARLGPKRFLKTSIWFDSKLFGPVWAQSFFEALVWDMCSSTPPIRQPSDLQIFRSSNLGMRSFMRFLKPGAAGALIPWGAARLNF
jgi:hypothetical protein